VKEPPLKPHDRGHVQKVEAHGALFIGAPRGTEVEQQQLGDCFFLAALASFAQRRPDDVRASIRAVGPGVYAVRFFHHDPATGGYAPREVTVDRILPEEHGVPIYATAVDGQGLWVSIYEKAYAALLHGYGVLNQGGDPAVAVGALTGRPAHTTWLENAHPEATWEALESGIAGGKLTLATTFGNADARAMIRRKRQRGDAGAHAYDPDTFDYKTNGLVSNHTYSVWALEAAGGRRAVRLRNPWGRFEPVTTPAHPDDGMFTISLAELTTLFANIVVGG
jgi:hypothetical protein